MEDIESRHIYDSVEETEDGKKNKENPNATKMGPRNRPFDINKAIKHAVVVECDENPYYEEVEVKVS